MPKGRPKKNGGGWPATDQNDRAAMDSWQDLLFNGGVKQDVVDTEIHLV